MYCSEAWSVSGSCTRNKPPVSDSAYNFAVVDREAADQATGPAARIGVEFTALDNLRAGTLHAGIARAVGLRSADGLAGVRIKLVEQIREAGWDRRAA